MALPQEQLLYVTVDTQGNCRPIAPDPAVDASFLQAIGHLGQLLDEGWQLVSENPLGRSESSLVLLRRTA
jgi:hypothetical protein